jgi:putative SOS response-associated peptidase YedK
MCGRFTSTVDADEVAARFAVDVPDGYRPRFNAAPTEPVLAVFERAEAGRVAELVQWGLLPHFAKDRRISHRMINARSETVLQRSAFRELMDGRRCLVPADGFYEWRVAADGTKEPIRYTLADGSLFAFAGLRSSWVNRETGEVVDSCAILTTRANELVAPLHHRMPGILPGSAEAPWLDPAVSADAAADLLLPLPAELMTCAAASRRVNAAGVDEPGLLEPDPPRASLLDPDLP